MYAGMAIQFGDVCDRQCSTPFQPAVSNIFFALVEVPELKSACCFELLINNTTAQFVEWCLREAQGLVHPFCTPATQYLYIGREAYPATQKKMQEDSSVVPARWSSAHRHRVLLRIHALPKPPLESWPAPRQTYSVIFHTAYSR